MVYLIGIIIFICLLLETTILQLPLTLILLLLLFVMKKSPDSFFYAFIAGSILDLFLLRPIGATSLFFIVFLFLLFLYERKYEIKTIPFTVIAAFLGTFLFNLLVGKYINFLQPFLAALLSGVLFWVLMKYQTFQERKKRKVY